MKSKRLLLIIFNIIMLIFSIILLINASKSSFDLLSNPDLNIATELIRLFWGVVGVIYFLIALLKAIF